MSFLSIALPIIGIVGAIATGGAFGIVAGALLATSFAASQGWLGKGAQNFANSAAGHDITLAVGLASAAVAVGNIVTAASSASSTAVEAANAAAEGPPTALAGGAGGAAAGAASDAAPVAGVTATSNEVIASASGPGGMAMQFQSMGTDVMEPTLSQTSVDAVYDMQNASALASGTSGVGGNPVSPDEQAALEQTVAPQATASQAQSAATTADQTAVNPGGQGAPVTGTPNAGPVANPNAAAANATAEGPPTSAANGGNGPGLGGTLKNLAGKATSALGTPAGMLMAGQAISGLAQGKAAENIAQRQLAAAQWGNIQWTDPNQVAQLNSQAGQSINVPSGYLARAAAVRNLMNGSTNQTAPLQGPATPAPAAPSLGAPGAGLATGQASQGPVPVTAMNAVPRGGVI